MKKTLSILGVLVIALVLLQQRVAIADFFVSLGKPALPEPVAYEESQKTADDQDADAEPSVANTTAPKPPAPLPQQPVDGAGEIDEPIEPTLPDPAASGAVNLAVPFQPQAPFANWVEPYKEGCEEASLIMVDYYLQGVGLSAQEMQDAIDDQVTWQHAAWGGHYDLTVEQVIELGREFYDYHFETIAPLTLDAIRAQLQRGRPVIVPSAGRELGNPYFTAPGPFYHMLVIKGMTADGRFITNDPGTRRGADYVYDATVLLAAIRDWDGDSPDGARVGFVMYR